MRPTPDRVRETLFNWLQPWIADSVCLDLFAGSGALGFEAASRGASRVIMVERDTAAFRQLRENGELLGSRQIEVIHADALAYLEQSTLEFDIVFLDPPYQSALLEPACQLLIQGHLKPGALVYIETASGQDAIDLPDDWHVIKNKTAGQVNYRLIQTGGE